MLRTLKTLGAAVAGMVMLALPALAAPTFNPEGAWEPGGKDMLYNVYLCGDGTQLCATLDWAAPKLLKGKPDNYVGSKVFYDLKPRGQNTWRGDFDFLGRRVSGTVKLVDENHMKLRGCVYVVVCGDAELFRKGTR